MVIILIVSSSLLHDRGLELPGSYLQLIAFFEDIMTWINNSDYHQTDAFICFLRIVRLGVNLRTFALGGWQCWYRTPEI